MLFLGIFLIRMLSLGDSLSFGHQDTLDLGMVEVYSMSLDKYSFGQTVQSLSAKDMESFQGQSLGDYLQQRTGLFLRQHGSGMLSSLTMRGTSAGHNAVYWNGLPINSPSLGQSDFSILPIVGFDKVTLQFGGSGALYGTDAIGGTVHLSSNLRFGQGNQLKVSVVNGSFGRWNQQIQYSRSNKKFSSRSSIYKAITRNDFKFQNISKPGSPIENQQNASIAQWGAMQDFAWSINDRNMVNSSLWVNLTDREIQPLMGSNTKDSQKDVNLRWVIDYYHFGNNRVWNVKTGYVFDQQEFNQFLNQTSQYLISADLDWKFAPKWNSKVGSRLTFIQGNLSTYSARETRTEIYQSTNFQANEALGISLNLRQLLYDSNLAPFTPSLGVEWLFFKVNAHQLRLNSALSRSFKLPTLNDRFWIPGGNRELDSEKSVSGEIGLKHGFRKDKFSFDHRLTYFRMVVDNWIIWLPEGNIWSPKNIRKVNNSGIEYFLKSEMRLASVLWVAEMNYSWNRAINQTEININDRAKGNQLPYTPEHKYQFTGSMEMNGIKPYFNTHWIGERFIGTDNSTKLPAYGIWDIGTNYQFDIFRKIQINTGFQINNLLNTDYQVMRLRAMPGRNYQINLNFTL